MSDTAVDTAAFPSTDEMRSVDKTVNDAQYAVERLAWAVRGYVDPFDKDSPKPKALSTAQYGAVVLYLDSMRLALGSALDSIKLAEERLDEVVWEAVDLDGADA